MYVCICKGITDTQVRQAMASGATGLKDIVRSLGLAQDCAQCVNAAREVMASCKQACS